MESSCQRCALNWRIDATKHSVLDVVSDSCLLLVFWIADSGSCDCDCDARKDILDHVLRWHRFIL